MFLPEHANRNTFRWANGVLEACKRFRTGDVIENVSLVFATEAETAVTTLAQDAADGASGLIGVRAPLPLAMITSQTCDIAGQRGAKYPLMLVAPVYDITGHTPNGLDGHIRKTPGVGELVHLTGPRFARDGELWVADLRFEAPVEKGILLNREPILAFANEPGYLRCAEKIAAVRMRAAIDDDVDKAILAPLREQWRTGRLDHSSIIDVFVKATPTTNKARAARVYLIVKEDADVHAIQDAHDEWHCAIASTLPAHLSFLGIQVKKGSEFTWIQQRGCVPLATAYLSEDPE